MAPIKTPAEKKKPTSNKAAVSKKKVYISPDIYRSILDEPQIDGPAYRYSDEELNEFKEIIMSKMDIARKEVHYLQGLLQNHSDGGATSRNGDINGTDLAVSNSEKEQLTLLASRQLQLINHLEKALVRIENKTYGICRVTGKMIDKARLRAVPHATLSIEAKKTQYSTRV
ncbi:TraR/DksA family transcriptional regulator [Patescibacteria group bacterium]|nr:TraR/DksA family transcriptional regulator [Patescibacteria group bacterium]